MPRGYRTILVRAALPYLGLSAVWIVGTDWLVHASGLSAPAQLAAENLKGLFFVVLSGAYITLIAGYLLQRALRSERRRSTEAADRQAFHEALPGPVFQLDGDGRVCWANHRFLQLFGFEPGEVVGAPAGNFMKEEDRGAVAAAIMRCLASREPQVIEARLVRKDGTAVPYLWSGTPLTDEEGRATGVVGFGLDITRQHEAREVLEEHVAEVENVLGETVRAIALAMEVRDAYTSGHQQKVTQLAVAIGRRLGLDGERLKGLELASAVHDVGKLGVPADILTLPRRLTGPEMMIVRDHVEWGYRILKDVRFPWPVATIVRQHHERLDGSGYPLGASGDAILLESRILAVADVVESITSHRPYRPALGLEKALEEIEGGAGVTYDASVVRACRELFDAGFAFAEPRPPTLGEAAA